MGPLRVVWIINYVKFKASRIWKSFKWKIMPINVGTFLCNSSFLKSCQGNKRLIMWGAAQREWAPQPCPAERREPAADRAPFFPTFCTSSQADGWSALSEGRDKLPRLCYEMIRTMWVLEEMHDDALSPLIVFRAIQRRKCATGPITHCKQFLLFRTGNGSFAREDRVHQTRRLTLIGCGVCRGGGECVCLLSLLGSLFASATGQKHWSQRSVW